MRIASGILLQENYKMNTVDIEITDLLNQYLIDCKLSKISYFTNYIPTKSESEYLTGYFSYICFCASSFSEQSLFLFNKNWAKFRKVPFDVFVSTVEECVIARQYNFVSLKCNDQDDAKRMVSFVKENKHLINRNYPILLRLIIETKDFCDSIDKNGLNVECELSSIETIVRIDR